jgi:hypothetical protein
MNGYAPINDSNRYIKFTDSAAAVFTISVAAGIYELSELATALTTAFTAAGSANTFTVTSSDITKKLTITSNLNFSLNTVSNNMYYEMGIDTSQLSVTGTSIVSNQMVRLDGPDYVDVQTSITAVRGNYHNSASAILARIPLTGSYGEFINFSPENPVTLYAPSDASVLRNFSLTLLKPDGTMFTLPDNCYVSYVIVSS